MKKVLFLSLMYSATLCAQLPMEFSGGGDMGASHLIVNNRVLLKVEGKPITVLDIARKLDLLFYQQFPQYAASDSARYQFYSMHWRTVLANAIDDALILADAEEKKVTVGEGEIKEEFDRLFGAGAVFEIDKLGLSYAEAYEMLRSDLLVQRMTGGMVHVKAFSEVNPQKTRALYDKKLAEMPKESKWCYQVVSIRSPDEEENQSVATQAHALVKESGLAVETALNTFTDSGAKITLSEDYERSASELSILHKEALERLDEGEMSDPVVKKGVCYLFLLKEKKQPVIPTFQEQEKVLKSELLQTSIAKHNEQYRKKLRDRYGLSDAYLDEQIPEDFAPFSLR